MERTTVYKIARTAARLCNLVYLHGIRVALVAGWALGPAACTSGTSDSDPGRAAVRVPASSAPGVLGGASEAGSTASPPSSSVAVAEEASGAGGDVGIAQNMAEVAPAPGTAGSPVGSSDSQWMEGSAAADPTTQPMDKPDTGTAGSEASGASALWIPDPSWDCGMPEGIPPPTVGESQFAVVLKVDALDLGTTQYGERLVLNATAGSIRGEELEGTVVEGAYDYQLRLPNGSLEVEEIGVLRSGRDLVYFRHCGLATDDDAPGRLIADFEAANSGPLAWLNEGLYLGERTYNPEQQEVLVTFYRLPDEGWRAATDSRLTFADPPEQLDQAWDCPAYTGRTGDVVYRESVGIGSTLSVGRSKRGTRNVIPIIGGQSEGRLPGEVLSGGADYQLLGDGFELDARYVIRGSTGEFVAVRNCGLASALVPIFETAVGGEYHFLNANTWLSSRPQIAVGAVNLTIYERL